MSESGATLIVVRPTAGSLPLRPVEIYLDGRLHGQIDTNFAAIACPSGPHEVAVKAEWCRSLPVPVTLPPGGRAELICRFRLPTNRFARPGWLVLIGLIVFAHLYVLVPSIKMTLRPYESYWGPVFVVLLGLSLLACYAEMVPQLLAILSRKPGKALELAIQEPTVTDEMIAQQRIEESVRPSRLS